MPTTRSETLRPVPDLTARLAQSSTFPVFAIAAGVMLIIALVWGLTYLLLRTDDTPPGGPWIDVGQGGRVRSYTHNEARCMLYDGASSVAISCEWGPEVGDD